MKKTTEQFIKEAKAVHENKYDYSQAEYTGCFNKIKIICPDHGMFEQQASKHKGGSGCRQCGIEQIRKKRTKTQEQFISDVKAVHGNKYDYSQAKYVMKHINVKIICPEHGVFEQQPANHQSGAGCPHCALEKRRKKRTKTTEQFISDAKAVHGDKYDYSLTEYTGCFNKVKIICPKHGEFEQGANDHTRPSRPASCPLCAHRVNTPEEFIAKAQSVHGDRYDYSLVEYRGGKTKVKIICPEHGALKQAPRTHLEGSICKLCSHQARRKTTEQFIKEAKAVHGEKYDYSLVVLAGITKKVKIICPEHGAFEQVPHNHMRGNGGCPQCCARIHSQRMSDTFEQFVEKATAVHGNTYEYINYTPGKSSSVRLKCSEHGEFDQRAGNHLGGNGCKKCANALLSKSKTHSKEQFVERARACHGDKYDYSLVEYTGADNKVKIICPEHGVFEQAPCNHTGPWASDCPVCAKENARKKVTKTQEQFILEAKAVHGDEYDYSKAVYTKSVDKIKIICPEHGEFEVEAMSHLRGTRCGDCAVRDRGLNNRLTQEDFVKICREVHGDKYNYSLAEYVTMEDGVKIICPEHGVFEQRPGNHIGKGASKCPGCAKESSRKKMTKTTEQFILDAKAVHGDKYDYSLAEYVLKQIKVKIICPEHGVFEQTPNNHQRGRNCPRCASTYNKSEQEVREILEELFPDHSFPNIRPKWLRNPKTGLPLELDCYSEDLKLALEYQGFHHYSPIEAWGGEPRLKEIQERDQIKRDVCKQKGVTLLEADGRIFNRKSREEKKALVEDLLKEHSVIVEKL